MPDYEGYTPGQLLADASVADFIGSLGLSIAEAQRQLDENSISQISEYTAPRPGLNNSSLIQLGLSPAFYHYQYADLTCELDLKIRITKSNDVGFGVKGYYNDKGEFTGDNSSSSTETGSSTFDKASFRDAAVRMKASSANALTINNKSYTATGSSAFEKIGNLQDQITRDSKSGINALLYTLENPTEFKIESDADVANVITTKRTVTITGGDFSHGVIRVTDNAPTTYVLNSAESLSVDSTTKDNIDLYAESLVVDIKAKGFDAELIDKNENAAVADVYFDTGKHIIRNATEHNKLRNLADYLKATQAQVKLQGFADRQIYRGQTPPSSENLNIQLGNRRAHEVKEMLVALGVPSAKVLITPSLGQAEADQLGAPGAKDEQRFRRVSAIIVGRTNYWIVVSKRNGGPNLEQVAPPVDTSNNPLSGTGNRFIYLRSASTLDLSGKKVSINDKDYPLRGDAIDGYALHSAEAYAHNLAKDINANTQANYSATPTQNVVTVVADADEFSLIMVTSSEENLTIRESDGLRITKQFAYTATKSDNSEYEVNKKVAVGAAVDARFKRSFEMEAVGNSRISARLVSIPAPPQFLDAISQYLATVGTGDFTRNPFFTPSPTYDPGEHTPIEVPLGEDEGE